jgi:hypothetical protein
VEQRQGQTLSLVHVGERPVSAAPNNRQAAFVSFSRRELSLILGVYGRKVSSGEWRDYAMDFLRERAMFSVFARNSEKPLFMIEKMPKLARKQGQYLVTNQQGRVLKRGHELDVVLRILDPQLAVVT